MNEVSSDPITLSIERPALYVVATPIGNLSDISYRAVALLGAVDYLLVEDTRVTQRVLRRYAIDTPMRALHEHNERERSAEILRRARDENLALALVSDAGTPLVADPGYRIVTAAAASGVPVYAAPGPCAAIAALSVCGLPTDRFAFEGFLPARAGARRHRLEALAGESRTLVFYEAPHRILASVADMVAIFGSEREAAVARELTKLHETIYRGPLAGIAAAMSADPNASRGEFVIVVAGANAAESDAAERRALEMVDVLNGYLSRADAIRAAADITGVKRNVLYRLSHDERGS